MIDARSALWRRRDADRVLFGTDGPWPEQRLKIYWRFLETRDPSIDYSEKEPPPPGSWKIHVVGLPDEVLRKIYHKNAARWIPGVAQRQTTWPQSKRHRHHGMENHQ